MRTAAQSFASDPSSVPAARRFAVRTLTGWGLPAAAEAVEVLVSEVVTNAVLHARTEHVVEVVHDGDVVRVRVTDGSPALPRQRAYASDSTTGRGVRLVETLSAAWGVERSDAGDGKTVWFEVPSSGEDGSAATSWDADADVDAVLARFGGDEGAEGSSAPARAVLQRSWLAAAA